MEKALARIELMKRPILDHKKIDLDFQSNKRSGKDVVTVERARKAYGNQLLFSNIIMHVRFQERVAIIGENVCKREAPSLVFFLIILM